MTLSSPPAKAYQTDGTMPDWEALAQAIEAVRETAL
jgi:hypothetical protein